MSDEYISQQSTFLQNMISYLQDETNWSDKIPKITELSPGSVAHTLLSSISVAMDGVGYEHFITKQATSILTATGTELDNIAAIWGIKRKDSAAGLGTFKFSRNVVSSMAIMIPTGTIITTLPSDDGSVIQYTTKSDAVIESNLNSVQVSAVCSSDGKAGNISSNINFLISSPLPGVDKVELLQDITNGSDQENDDSLRARCIDTIQNMQNEGSGTANDYRNWVMGVNGVKDASVWECNRGPGTVDIVVLANNGIPDSNLLQQCQSAIDSKKPICVDAKAIAPVNVVVTANITLSLAKGYTKDSVLSAVQSAVTNYINSILPGKTVYSSGIIAKVVDIPGILDCTVQLSVNSINYTNVALSNLQIATAGNINIS